MEYLIEVEAATAEPPVLRFKTGKEVGPFHVGGKGKWQITGTGVADKHAYLYFNGTQLFLQSVSNETPVLADGRPLPCEWVPIAAPCEIAIGEAKLRYDTLDEIEIDNPDTDDRPLVPPPAPSAPSAPARTTTGSYGRPASDSDATRVVPFEELAAKRRTATGPTPNSGIPFSFNGPSSVAPPMPRVESSSVSSVRFKNGPSSVGPPMPRVEGPSVPSVSSTSLLGGSAPASVPPASVPPASVPPQQTPPQAFITTHPSMRLGLGSTIPLQPEPSQAKASGSKWREMSFARKATIILFLPMIAAVVVIFTDPQRLAGLAPSPPSSSGRSTTTAASTKSAPSAVPTARPTMAAPVEPVPTETPTASAATKPARPVPPPPPVPPPKPEVLNPKDRTLQRQAADAVATGAYDKAALIYDDLAKKYPDDPTYAAAAAIAHAKAAGN